MGQYALFGHPVAQSLSPRIHAAFARQTDIAMEYVAIDAHAGGFADALAAFAAAGGMGANVTVPLKETALALCATASDRARVAGAVNTLVRDGDGWRGDNTDGAGLVRDLTNRQGLDLRGRRVLMLGAGGAARGVAPALFDAGIDTLFVVNRTPERADALADALGRPDRVHTRYLEDLRTLGEFDLVVNATSATRDGVLPPLPATLLGRRSVALDLNYGAAAVPLLAWARAHDAAPPIDGLGMLVEQAALSFALWHGVEPETDPVYDLLRGEQLRLASVD